MLCADIRAAFALSVVSALLAQFPSTHGSRKFLADQQKARQTAGFCIQMDRSAENQALLPTNE
jgi:hypothetical protein